MWQAEFKLYLYPDNPEYKTDKKSLLSILKKLDFIHQELPNNRFATGDQFVSLLTFMGCSPNIELEPQKDSPYCYIEVESNKNPRFISGANLKKSRCTYCKKDITEPNLCPHCQQTLEPQNINWRKTAFFASCWVSIANIYELEAIPNDQFLDTLKNETGVKWKPAYIRKKT